MKKNELYDIMIEDMGNDGEGIGHIVEMPEAAGKAGKDSAEKGKNKLNEAEPECAADEKQSENQGETQKESRKESQKESRGVVVFVKDTVVGDFVRIRIVKVKKQYAYGRLEEIISPSPYRVDAPCTHARSCGGCTLMHMSYEKQLEYKWNKVRNCMERIGGLENAGDLIEPIHGMTEPYHYRNKMQFPVGLDKNGRVQIGFYAGRTHSIIDLENCKIGHPVNDYILKELRVWLQTWQDRTGRFIYDEEQHKGLVRHILTRVGFTTGELMVCVVINGGDLPSSSLRKGERKESANEEIGCSAELVKHMLSAVDAYNRSKKEDAGIITLKSLSININREQTNRILGDTCKTLWGESFITDYIGDIAFRISPMSFYQVNPVQTRLLYDKAVEYADLSGKEVVWDMYCGIGTISLCLARKAKKVYGVEIVPQAIADARENAALNGIDNTEFFCGKAEEVVPEFYRKGENAGRHPDVVVVDPPRKGCEEVLLRTIVEMAPNRLVYVSCDPATLARDVKRLGEMGYEVKKAAVYDQFGHSGHCESVVLMSRINKIQLMQDFGIEIVRNNLSAVELEESGYHKISLDESGGFCFEQLFKSMPQNIAEKVNNKAVQKAFEEATENTYKCILDPSKHLAKIKGTDDYIGAALDNNTNQVAGQARWRKNDVKLSVSNIPQIASNVFNVLSIITGQHFMEEINEKLSDVKDKLDGLESYLDDIKESELETAFQELNEILKHLSFIKNDPERVQSTIRQLDDIRKVAKEGINRYKKQLKRIISEYPTSDKEEKIKDKTAKLRGYMIYYRYAVYIYNLAQLLKIYMNNITDVTELQLYRDELLEVVNQYTGMVSETKQWYERYLNETDVLNKESIKQLGLSLAVAMIPGGTAIREIITVCSGIHNNYKIDEHIVSPVYDLFANSRKKKKEKHINCYEEYQKQVNDMSLLDYSIREMDRYIDMTNKRAEIIYTNSGYYINYLDESFRV